MFVAFFVADGPPISGKVNNFNFAGAARIFLFLFKLGLVSTTIHPDMIWIITREDSLLLFQNYYIRRLVMEPLVSSCPKGIQPKLVAFNLSTSV